MNKETGLGLASRTVAELLPSSWRVSASTTNEKGEPDVDDYLTVSAPDGKEVTFLVDVLSASHMGGQTLIGSVLWRARQRRLPPMLVVPYAGPGLRRVCEENDVSFVD